MSPEQAQTIALQVLAFLAGSPDGLERLMEQSGSNLALIREQAADRHFLGAVLDFLMANEQLLVEFCESTRTEPQAVQLASHALGGG